MQSVAIAEVRAVFDAAIGSTRQGEDTSLVRERVRVSGKFLRLGQQSWFLKGFTYGPFAPNSAGAFLPERPQILQDLGQMRRLGANCLRLYHIPDRQFLDDALEAGLRVFVDVPWDKHRCFFEDWDAQSNAMARLHRAARDLGSHPAVFAISVGNEIPKDVVRFYGARRVERFIDRLLDIVKQQAPDCLTTYTNYPSTEFLVPSRQDFYCLNVYLEEGEVLGRYLNHVQHVAGTLPVILGEYGVDSIRHGEDRQAKVLQRHVQEVFSHGLAGSFTFSFTDDWFTGGHAIEGWAFGVTNRVREEKPAALAMRDAWADVQAPAMQECPMVSVVVCTYNGSATLRECLEALLKQEYPRYEIILIDDGSTDQTPQIAADFPTVRYLRQVNLGLSAARNAGAVAAEGTIVAYTDDDCVADESWLTHLVGAMRKQGVDAIGGPNVPPSTDGWVAKCVAASPGGPSHVMLDDSLAEHVPGCNMAFTRDKLLALGGFDVQFRAAGDDVDICWRFSDAGMSIGYAAGALVWHHRRKTVGAYLRQQRGYGRSEAMLRFKHPQRFNQMGCSRWRGVIYGEGAVGLPLTAPAVYYGRFGSGLFQTIYHRNDYSSWGYFVLLEWHAMAALLAATSIVAPALLSISAAMWLATLAAAARSAWTAPLARESPWWCRPLVFGLHILQPIVRSWHRYRYRLHNKHVPMVRAPTRRLKSCTKRISLSTQDLYWMSTEGRGREEFLAALQQCAAEAEWQGTFDDEWGAHDVELIGGAWHHLRIHTATEEIGNNSRFTRVRASLRWTLMTSVLVGALGLWTLAAVVDGSHVAAWVTVALWLVLIGQICRSRHRCRKAVLRLIWRAGRSVGLEPAPVVAPAAPPKPAKAMPVWAESAAGKQMVDADANVCVE